MRKRCGYRMNSATKSLHIEKCVLRAIAEFITFIKRWID
jgi:hypothetical protein